MQKAGKVSLITSRNVYVKFDNTSGIKVGDTLKLLVGDKIKPCLLVENKSSISCVCVIMNGCEVKKDDIIIHRNNSKPDKVIFAKAGEDSITIVNEERKNSYKSRRKEKIFGTISASGNSGFSNIKADRHRMMYGLSLDAINIKESKFSLETDISYSQNFIPVESYTREKIFLRIQNFAIKYDVDSSMHFTAGRQINSKVTSLGAIDGLQGEKHFGNFYVGVLAGFRPDIYDYNFNSRLLQYGGYLGIQSDKKNGHI